MPPPSFRVVASALALFGLLGGVALLSSCSLLTTIDDDVSGGFADAGQPDSVGVANGEAGGNSPDDGSSEASSTNGCATAKGGPPLVRVDVAASNVVAGGKFFCVDRTEVTKEQYLAFTQAGSAPSKNSKCKWKTSYQPGGAWPPTDAERELPVTVVDWCDADAFCTWAGKRLCSAMNGDALNVNAAGDLQRSMLPYACSGGGERTFSYGSTFDGLACNDKAYGANEPIKVASLPKCEGGFPGIFDLLGNVVEWIDACNDKPGGPEADQCAGFNSPYYEEAPDELYCSYVRTNLTRNEREDYVGFRCCSF